jgi:hypothetical protein
MDSMKPDLNFLLTRCTTCYTSTKTATVALRYRVLDISKLCPVAENFLKILDPSSTESGDDYTKFTAEMPKGEDILRGSTAWHGTAIFAFPLSSGRKYGKFQQELGLPVIQLG